MLVKKVELLVPANLYWCLVEKWQTNGNEQIDKSYVWQPNPYLVAYKKGPYLHSKGWAAYIDLLE